MMQDLVGIVRREDEMERALDGIAKLKQRADKVGVGGNREYNPGWHTALDLNNLLTVSEAIALRGAASAKKAAARISATTIRRRIATYGSFNFVISKAPDGDDEDRPRAAAADDRRAEADDRGDEVDTWLTQLFESGGATSRAASSAITRTEISEGMVVLDAVHHIQAEQANDLAVRWNCKAGKCGSCSAEINGMPKLMCMTRLNTLPLDQPVTIQPMKTFPLIKDLVTDVSWNYQGQEEHQEVQAAQAGRAGRNAGAWSRPMSTVRRSSASASSVSCARTFATCCAIINCTTSSSGRAS